MAVYKKPKPAIRPIPVVIALALTVLAVAFVVIIVQDSNREARTNKLADDVLKLYE